LGGEDYYSALHVAVRCDGNEIWYTDNVGTAGNMIHAHGDTADPGARSDPALVVAEEADKVYVAYFRRNASHDSLTVRYCTASSCNPMSGVPDLLNSARHWDTANFPNVATNGTTLYLSFVGINDDHANDDIWFISYAAGGSVPVSPNLVTDDAEVEVLPRLGWVDSDSDTFVVGWRNLDTLFSSRDAYIYHYSIPSGITRQVFASVSGVEGGYFDLAVEGEWVAGAWVDYAVGSTTQLVPWVSQNGRLTYLPLTRK
jgi:hypothetical protein